MSIPAPDSICKCPVLPTRTNTSGYSQKHAKLAQGLRQRSIWGHSDSETSGPRAEICIKEAFSCLSQMPPGSQETSFQCLLYKYFSSLFPKMAGLTDIYLGQNRTEAPGNQQEPGQASDAWGMKYIWVPTELGGSAQHFSCRKWDQLLKKINEGIGPCSMLLPPQLLSLSLACLSYDSTRSVS